MSRRRTLFLIYSFTMDERPRKLFQGFAVSTVYTVVKVGIQKIYILILMWVSTTQRPEAVFVL